MRITPHSVETVYFLFNHHGEVRVRVALFGEPFYGRSVVVQHDAVRHTLSTCIKYRYNVYYTGPNPIVYVNPGFGDLQSRKSAARRAIPIDCHSSICYDNCANLFTAVHV